MPPLDLLLFHHAHFSELVQIVAGRIFGIDPFIGQMIDFGIGLVEDSIHKLIGTLKVFFRFQ